MKDYEHVITFLNRIGVSDLLAALLPTLTCAVWYFIWQSTRSCAYQTYLSIAHIHSSRILGSFRDCKLETPLRKRRSRASITNEFSAKRQRVSEAIGSIDVSTDPEQRQEYADINAEPRVSFHGADFRN